MKKDAYYFPHFCNARHDRKLKRVQKELGVEGYGIYFMVLEVLREQPDFKYPMEDLDLLADEFGTSEQKLSAVVCNYKLFTVDDEKNFISPKLIEYLRPYIERSKRARDAANLRWSKSNANALPEHSKSNASKVKKSKEESTLDNEFESFWELFQKKEDKKKCETKWKNISKKDKELIFKTVSSYVESTPDKQYRKNPLTWLNGECWNNDYSEDKTQKMPRF